MISWTEYKARQEKEKEKIRVAEEGRLEALYEEMCDVCGHNSPNIQRTAFFSKSGVRYVIRYCENCNPYWRWCEIKA